MHYPSCTWGFLTVRLLTHKYYSNLCKTWRHLILLQWVRDHDPIQRAPPLWFCVAAKSKPSRQCALRIRFSSTTSLFREMDELVCHPRCRHNRVLCGRLQHRDISCHSRCFFFWHIFGAAITPFNSHIHNSHCLYCAVLVCRLWRETNSKNVAKKKSIYVLIIYPHLERWYDALHRRELWENLNSNW